MWNDINLEIKCECIKIFFMNNTQYCSNLIFAMEHNALVETILFLAFHFLQQQLIRTFGGKQGHNS